MRSKFFGLALSAMLFALCASTEAQQPARKFRGSDFSIRLRL